MKHLNSYKIFEEKISKELTKAQKNFLDDCTLGEWKFNSETGLVDIKGDFSCTERKLTSFLGIRFGRVTGNFSCDINRLSSLEGAPQWVGKDFSCCTNPLESLAGAPLIVKRDFFCGFNSLFKTLEGSPQEVGRDFWCEHADIDSLIGAPPKIKRDFHLSCNDLTSLEGAPQEVGGSFLCDNNKLQSLKGGPRIVGGNYDCAYNENTLVSLEGAPLIVKGKFSFDLDFQPGEEFDPEFLDIKWDEKGWIKVLDTRPDLFTDLIPLMKDPQKIASALKGDLVKLSKFYNGLDPQVLNEVLRIMGTNIDYIKTIAGAGNIGFFD